MPTNLELLGYLNLYTNSCSRISGEYQRILDNPNNKQLIDKSYGTINAENARIASIQSGCIHPIGIEDFSQVYCPICGKVLSPEAYGIIIPINSEIERTAISEKLAEALSLTKEASPSEMASYIESKLQELHR